MPHPPPPRTAALSSPPPHFSAPFLEVCFGMKPVILVFFFFPLRRILHQNTDFLFEETGGFGIGPVSALTRMGMTFQKPNGKGPGDTAALCPKTPSSPQLSPLTVSARSFSELTSWHFSPRSK